MPAAAFDWTDHYPAAVSVCDTKGTILAMNRQAEKLFAHYGGKKMIGSSLFACHPPPANVILRQLLREQPTNTSITKKKGERKLIHQAPWSDQGQFAGLV